MTRDAKRTKLPLPDDASRSKPRHPDDCSRFDPLIAAGLDGALDPSAEEELAGHLAGCAGCRALSRRLRESALALEAVPEPALGDAAAAAFAEAAPHDVAPDRVVPLRRGRGLELLFVAVAAGALGLVASRVGASDPAAAERERGLLARRLESAEQRIRELEEAQATRPGPAPAREAAPVTAGAASAPAAPADSAPAAPSAAPEPERTSPPTPRSSENGTLSVACVPACEHVLIDGLDMGAAPMKATFAVGNHQIKVVHASASGEVTRMQSTDVVANRESRLHFNMRE